MHLLIIYLIGILLLSGFRIVFLHLFYLKIWEWDQPAFIACAKGWRFDNLVMCYLLIVPVLIELVVVITKIDSKIKQKIQAYIFAISFPIILMLSMGDLPHFAYFRNRISESSFQWMGQAGIVLDMIVSNKINLMLLVTSVILGGIISRIIYKTSMKWSEVNTLTRSKTIVVYFILLAYCLIGMRGGRLHPLRASDAFFTDNPVLNQAGLNAPFTLMKSFSNKVRLMDEKQALRLTKNYLGHKERSHEKFKSPIARMESKDNRNDTSKKMNVVLVLMEGMSADYLGVFGNKNGLTPRLDSLSKECIFYTNAYSAGIHTNNGIFSSLYGFPALKRVRPMGEIPLRKYSGLPYQLKKMGYHNLFISTSSKAFDNLSHFIYFNHFDQLIGQEDYPDDKSIGPYGVPDDYMFQSAISTMDSLSTDQPFFATLLTASNHDPYIIPESFDCKDKDIVNCGVAYADWAIGRFIDKVKTKKWYNNTLFVFCSDHGRVVDGGPYEMDLSNNHIVLLVHNAQTNIISKKDSSYIQQIDIFPTVMHYLSNDYINNTMGINAALLSRPYAYFSADDKIGCINDEWLYIYRYNGIETLHHRKSNSPKDYSKINKKIFTTMRNYALAQTQTAEWIIKNNYCNPEQ